MKSPGESFFDWSFSLYAIAMMKPDEIIKKSVPIQPLWKIGETTRKSHGETTSM